MILNSITNGEVYSFTHIQTICRFCKKSMYIVQFWRNKYVCDGWVIFVLIIETFFFVFPGRASWYERGRKRCLKLEINILPLHLWKIKRNYLNLLMLQHPPSKISLIFYKNRCNFKYLLWNFTDLHTCYYYHCYLIFNTNKIISNLFVFSYLLNIRIFKSNI